VIEQVLLRSPLFNPTVSSQTGCQRKPRSGVDIQLGLRSRPCCMNQLLFCFCVKGGVSQSTTYTKNVYQPGPVGCIKSPALHRCAGSVWLPQGKLLFVCRLSFLRSGRSQSVAWAMDTMFGSHDTHLKPIAFKQFPHTTY